MSATPARAPVISLSEGFGALVVQGPNIEVEVRDAERSSSAPASLRWLLPSLRCPAQPLPLPSKLASSVQGGTEHAGWICGGVSKTTERPFYIAPKNSG